MKINRIIPVYFSATYTTRRIVRRLAEQMGGAAVEYDITQSAPDKDITLEPDDLLIAGMPVYAGRIPMAAAQALRSFKGRHTPAVAVCVYGNRAYDDALLELADVLCRNGFATAAAGAFVAQHSIFPAVGQGRPDEQDMARIDEFAQHCRDILDEASDAQSLSTIRPKGNRPYKTPGKIPLHPSASRRCTACGVCVKLCPAQAIPADAPRTTDKTKCISCGRCIVVCPVKARRFGGLLYTVAAQKFAKACAARREPEVFLPAD